MKKKIITLSLLFMMIFSSNVFAQTFPTMDNIKPTKIWTITFNKDIKSIRMSIKDKDNQYISCMVYIRDKQVMVVPFSNYAEGEYILNISTVTSTNDSTINDVATMKFIVKE